MNLDSLETVILFLLFFLPGYIYYSLKSKFHFQSWEDKEIIFVGFFFSSIIFQLISWFILQNLFGINILEIFRVDNSSIDSIFLKNIEVIAFQISVALFIAITTAIFFSTKQFKRSFLWILKKFHITTILDIGLEYTPPLMGALEHDTDYGRKMIGCVIEMKNGIHYEGNIRNISHGKNEQDYLIVLSKVIKLEKGVKKEFPKEIKVLLPYKNIETISYKEYPLSENEKGSASLLPITIIFLLIAPLLLLLVAVQNNSNSLEFLKIVTELYGAFVVTFLGVYASLTYSKKHEKEREDRDREKVYVSALTLLASELSLNEQPLKTLKDAIDHIPPQTNKHYEHYGFLLEMVKDIRTDVFYNLISSPGITEISKNYDIFNKVQQAYFNTIKTVNGLSLSREVFSDYYKVRNEDIPKEFIDKSNEIIKQESQKIERTLKMVEDAKNTVIEELKQHNITFVDESNTP